MCSSSRAGGKIISTSPVKVTEVVLRDESTFGDIAPRWKGAPTANDACRERLRLIRRLRRFSLDFVGAAELAGRLQTCRPHHRCTSGACPECARGFQRWFVAQLQRLNDVE